MFQILKNPDFDFMKRSRLLMGISGVLVLASIGILLVKGLNLGIEFTGGAEIQVKYSTRPDEGAIRDALKQAGMTNNVVTTIGAPEDNEVYIRLGVAEGEEGAESQDSLIGTVVEMLKSGSAQPGRVDLNVVAGPALEAVIQGEPTLTVQQARQIAADIADRRKEIAIYASLDEIGGIPGVTPELLEHLRQTAYVGPLAVRSQSYIGPTIGHELMDKARLAITASLIVMLIYIWIRFQIQWGFAAVLALTHDTLLTLGLFSLFGKEMSLPVIAAFLTLVGYSVNDTVVVFDRIRENLRNRSAPTLAATINLSINQTLGRTIITSGLTWVVVFGLYLFGGPALNSFAFVLSAGVIVGTYSSIYIASPVLYFWDEVRSRRAGAAAPADGRRARKVPTAPGRP